MRRTLLFIKKISRNLLSLSMIFSKGIIFTPFLFSQQPTPISGLGFHCQWTKGSFQSSRLQQGEGRGDRGDTGAQKPCLCGQICPACPPTPTPDPWLFAQWGPGLPSPWPSQCSLWWLPHPGPWVLQLLLCGQGCLLSRVGGGGSMQNCGTPSHSSSDPCLDLGEMSPSFTSAGTCATWR